LAQGISAQLYYYDYRTRSEHQKVRIALGDLKSPSHLVLKTLSTPHLALLKEFMTEGLKQAYIDSMNAQFKELGARVELIKARVAKGTSNLRIDFHTQVEHWQKNEELFKKKLEDVRASTAENFEVVKSGVQAAWTDLSKYVADNFDKITEKASDKTTENKGNN